MRTLLILFMVGMTGEGLLAHAGMAGNTACSFIDDSAIAMPIDHSAMTGSTSETEQTICVIKCMAVAIFLPVAPVVLVPVEVAQMRQLSSLLLPAPVVSGPDGPPPKRLFV